MAEPEAGTVTAEQALLLLLLEGRSDLKKLEADGSISQIAPGRYWLKDLVQGYIKHLRLTATRTDTQTLAACWGVSSSRVNSLARDGWFKKANDTRGAYSWIDACSGFVKFLRDEDRRATRGQVNSRIQDAKARDIEVRTLQRLGRLIPLEVYEEMIDSICGMVRTEFSGLAAATTRDLVMRRIIEREVNARLRRIAEHALAEAVRLEKSSRAPDAIGADGAGSVGGEQSNVPTNGGGAGAA